MSRWKAAEPATCWLWIDQTRRQLACGKVVHVNPIGTPGGGESPVGRDRHRVDWIECGGHRLPFHVVANDPCTLLVALWSIQSLMSPSCWEGQADGRHLVIRRGHRGIEFRIVRCRLQQQTFRTFAGNHAPLTSSLPFRMFAGVSSTKPDLALVLLWHARQSVT